MPTLSTIGAACARAWGFTSGLVKDQYFNLVSLLLPGNGTNGAQNNTFLDSGTANSGSGFTITRNGNTTQGTFSPFSQTGWGAYFDGSNDYVSTPDSSAFDLAAVDWTIESWVYLNSLPSSTLRYTILGQWNSGANQLSYITQLYNNSGTMQLEFVYTANGSTATSVQVNATAVVANSWIHIAFVRDGSRLKFFVNGSEVTTSSNTISATIYNSSGNIEIGRNASATTNYINGYLSNLRLVKGTAVYTSNFTPSTTPLTAITNTSLLTFQSNRFVDNAATPNTLTPNNGTAISPFSPFAPTQSYSASAVGGSGYFDGTLDYLSIASTDTVVPTGTQDYAVEAWVYWGTQVTSYPQIISNPTTNGFQIVYDVSGGFLAVGVYNVRNAITYTIAQSALANQWTHIVVTRSGNTHRMMVNGVLRANGTDSISFASPTTQAIGSAGAANYFVGYISGLRSVLGSIPTTYQTSSTTNGTAIFDPPTAPPTTTSQGSSAPALLLNFTNAGVVDATAKNVLETVGNAQISTSVSKFGGGSIAFDGTGDYLTVPDNVAFDVGSGDWTIELWANFNSVSGEKGLVSHFTAGTPNAGYTLRLSTSNSPSGLRLVCSGSSDVVLQAAWTPVVSTWYHIAAVRNGGTLYIYVDGQQIGSTSIAITIGNPSALFAVGTAQTVASSDFNGYIDDLRFTKFARYTTGTGANAGKMVFNGTNTLALPTAPFPVQ